MTVSTVSQKRISITLSEQMIERLDRIALQYGVPRATMISMFVGQGVNSTEQVQASVQNGSLFSGIKFEIEKD